MGTQDSLWSVAPTTTVATKLVDLPFRPARLLASPDDTKIAILPAAVGSKVYVFYLGLAKLAPLSFTSLGVRQIDGMTWLSATKLLVSGSRSARQTMYPFTDRLYTATTTPGKAAAFRALRGTDPSAAPGAKLLVYERFRDGGKVTGNPGTRFVLESLIRLKLVAGSKPHVIGHVRYVDSLDILRFRDPDVSPDGKYVVTSTTGSDISGVLHGAPRCYGSDGPCLPHHARRPRRDGLEQHAATRSPSGACRRPGSFTDTYLYVFDPGLKKLTHSKPHHERGRHRLCLGARRLSAGLRAANARSARRPGSPVDDRPGLSSTPTDLGDGSLPVWLP